MFTSKSFRQRFRFISLHNCLLFSVFTFKISTYFIKDVGQAGVRHCIRQQLANINTYDS